MPQLIAPFPPSPAEVAVLEEAFVRGLAKAANGLSNMVGTEIGVVDPRIEFVSLPKLVVPVGRPDDPAVGIYLGITGDVAAHVVLLFQPDDAGNLADMLMGQPPGTTVELDAITESALGEVGNVMGSFFATVLGDLTGFPLWSTPPSVRTDMACALIDGLVASASDGSDQVLLVKTQFRPTAREHAHAIRGLFLVMPEVAGLATMLEALARCK